VESEIGDDGKNLYKIIYITENREKFPLMAIDID